MAKRKKKRSGSARGEPGRMDTTPASRKQKKRKTAAGTSTGARKSKKAESRQKVAADPRVTFPIVGIGASAGGIEAFSQLLENLPADTGMAFVFVQHLHPDYESALTEILARETAMPVVEAGDNMTVEPNHVYVIPPDAYLGILNGALQLLPRSEGGERRLAIDQFLRDLAADQHSHAIGVILSGTGSDGVLGLKAIKAEGGITFAQDEASAKYDGMPHSAIASGAADSVLPPARIATELAHVARHPYLVQERTGGTPEILPAGGHNLDKNGYWYSVRVRPYKTQDNKIDGAVIAFIDVNAMKQALDEARAARDYAEAVVGAVRHPMLVLDHDLRVVSASAAHLETFHVSGKETRDNLVHRLGNGQRAIPELRRLLGKVAAEGGEFNDFEVTHEFERIGTRTFDISGRQIPAGLPEGPMVLMQLEDVPGGAQAGGGRR